LSTEPHSTEKTIKWIKGALIGAGSFGQVYLGMDAATGLLMAVKQVSLPTGSGVNQERKKAMLSALEREIELLRELQHENIVQYHGAIICFRFTLYHLLLLETFRSLVHRPGTSEYFPRIRPWWIRHCPVEELWRL